MAVGVAASTPAACPKCGTAAPPGARFCNACGASLLQPSSGPAPSSVPAAAPPLDIRTQVDENRGLLKRLQLLVPGFHGYREGEDVRAADSILRRQVADKVKNARTTIENSRSALSNAGQFQALNDLAPIVADLLRLEGEIRNAEQGYTGISPSVRIQTANLDRLYEYDYGFAQAADQLNQTLAPLPSLAMTASTNPSGVPTLISSARGSITQLDQAFKARISAVKGVLVS